MCDNEPYCGLCGDRHYGKCGVPIVSEKLCGCGAVARYEVAGGKMACNKTIRCLSPEETKQALVEANKRIIELGWALQTALDLFKAADEERLKETYDKQTEAERWKAEGDMYGWNFHQGTAAGNTNASIIFHRVGRFLESRIRK